jgi:hypothetical protein
VRINNEKERITQMEHWRSWRHNVKFNDHTRRMWKMLVIRMLRPRQRHCARNKCYLMIRHTRLMLNVMKLWIYEIISIAFYPEFGRIMLSEGFNVRSDTNS